MSTITGNATPECRQWSPALIEDAATVRLSSKQALAMALIKNIRTTRDLTVEAELVIGRSSACGLSIEERYVSSRHAMLRWTGSCWQVRDLGSRNGTLVNGVLLEPKRGRDLVEGDQVAFGDDKERWQLVDAAPPYPMLIPADGSRPVQLLGPVCGVPADDRPEATAFRDRDGLWKLEDEQGALVVLRNGRSIELAGQVWRFSCPEAVGSTEAIDHHVPAGVRLDFKVSRDEEHVELTAIHGQRTVELGARGHNYLLLHLARVRIDDVKSGIPEAMAGWIYRDDLERSLNLETTQVNVDVFRIREHFSKFGLHECLSIIERRPRTGQLRIGTGELHIERL